MRLYKHHSFERGLETLQSSRLYFTPPLYFNDPFEFSPTLERELTEQEVKGLLRTSRGQTPLRQALKQIGVYTGTKHDFPAWVDEHSEELISIVTTRARNAVAEVRNRFTKLTSQYYGVCCLSECADSILMWAHYADSHRGLVIGYDIRDDEFRSADVLPVAYQRDRVTVPPDFFYNVKPHRNLVTRIMTSKSEDWSYEREYRIVSLLGDCREEEAAKIVRYYRAIRPERIREVIVGVRAPEDGLDSVRSVVEDQPQTSVVKAILDSGRFAIDVTEVT